MDVAKVSLNLYKLLWDFFGICNFFVGLGSVWTFLDSFGFYDETCLDLTSNFMFWTTNFFGRPKNFWTSPPQKIGRPKNGHPKFF